MGIANWFLIFMLFGVGLLAVEHNAREKNNLNPAPTIDIVNPAGIIGECQFEGRYWRARKTSNGDFRCNIKDAP